MSARADRLVFGVSGSVRRRELKWGEQYHLCVTCRRRRALFRHRGMVKADADHTLCFRCYRALQNHLRTTHAWRAGFDPNAQRSLPKEMR